MRSVTAPAPLRSLTRSQKGISSASGERSRPMRMTLKSGCTTTRVTLRRGVRPLRRLVAEVDIQARLPCDQQFPVGVLTGLQATQRHEAVAHQLVE